MRRGIGLFLLVLLVAGLPTGGRAEQKYTLTIAPAALPSPTLRYRLLPDPRDLRPGNAATIYYRSEALFVENAALLKDLREAAWYEYPTMPLKELPLAELEQTLQRARHFVRELEVAARYRSCDWQLGDREEGIALIIPDVQGFRMFGNLLAVKARVHIARSQYPEAIQALQTGYVLGTRLGQGPTLVHALVGIAIIRLMDDQLDTLIQQPDAPNLYWALRTLPRPLFDHRPILLEESQWLERMWPSLKAFDGRVLSPEEIQKAVGEIDARMKEFGLREPPLKNAARSAAIVALHGPARTWLLENGYRKEMVEAMNPVQAVALAQYRQFRNAYDEWLAWALAGEDHRRPGMKAVADRANAAGAVLDRLFFGNLLNGLFDGGIIPSFQKIEEAQLRTERRHVGLATLEALRLHAARNNGQWPEKLDDVKLVGIPVDPVTRRPWDYRREGGLVTMTSPLADGEKPTATTHLIYRVGLRAK